MKVVLDACSIINLFNGKVLQKVVAIPDVILYLSGNLLDQEILDEIQKMFVRVLVETGKVIVLQSEVSMSQFKALKVRYDLGYGETECIALCKNLSYHISTDDQKARKSSIRELGKEFVIGSLYLLREAVRSGIIDCSEALISYNLMKDMGGFLPKITQEYLCT